MSAEPIDRAVDRAHAALAEVARLAQLHGAWGLQGFADEACGNLLDAWERAE